MPGTASAFSTSKGVKVDSLLQSLSLGFLLRCLFSGVLGFLSYRAAKYGLGDTVLLTGFEARQIGVALLFGATTYGIYRSLIYPIIEGLLDSKSVHALRQIIPLISERSRRALKVRWERAGEEPNKKSGIVKHTTAWADWAHMQYTSALCILLGLLVGSIAGNFETHCHLLIVLIGFSTLFLFSAFVSDWRLHSVEDYLLSKDEQQLNPRS
jgi:hypothetical protein